MQTDLLHSYLHQAIENLRSLIAYTQEDIEDIKLAKHEVIFERSVLKSMAIKQFETSKNLIDKEIIALTQKYPHLELTDILAGQSDTLLTSMKSTLEELKQINTHYARMAFAVSEFYTSMAERLIPREKADYKSSVKRSQLLKIQV